MNSQFARFNGNVTLEHSLGVHSSTIYKIHYFQQFQAVITLTLDNHLTVWTLRMNQQYWPGISYPFAVGVNSLEVCEISRSVFVGLINGTIQKLVLSSDLNHITSEKSIYTGHILPVDILHTNSINGIILWSSNNMLGCFNLFNESKIFPNKHFVGKIGPLSSDFNNPRIFVAESNVVSVLTYDFQNPNNEVKIDLTLKSDKIGGIVVMRWCQEYNSLIVGTNSGLIYMWTFFIGDIRRYIFNYHSASILHVELASNYKQMISIDEVGNYVIWDLTQKRDEDVPWNVKNCCEECDSPFFWNLKQMIDKRKFGGRRHHCRNCGKSLCSECAKFRLCIPSRGHEISVYVCENCHDNIMDKKEKSCITFNKINSSMKVTSLNFASRKFLASNFYYPISIFNLEIGLF